MNLTTESYYDAEQKIWSGPRTERKFGPNITTGEVILDVLSRNPQKIIQISDTTGEEKTAAQLLSDSKLIAQYLMSLGISPGDVVGLYAKNTTNLTSVAIATLLCGTPYNAAFPGFDKENLMLVYKITTPKVIFCDVENYETLREAVKELELDAKIITINGELPGVESVLGILKEDRKISSSIRFPCADLTGDDTALILCSSGTTGSPKGITGSHSRFLESLVFFDFSSDHIIFSFSTFFWITGALTLFTALLNGATRIITEQPFTPEYFYHLVEKYGITHVLAPTEQAAALTKHNKPDTAKCLRSIKGFMIGGAKVHKSISLKLLEVLGPEPKLIIVYGLSECGTVSETSLSRTKSIRYDCEGKLMPNLEARIIDQITGEALGPNKQGLLHIRTPFKWAGYYRDEEATKKAYLNGWFNTNDIVYFDNEGHLYIFGRNSEIFKCSGFFICPNKLENLILQIPGVAEVCVFPKPDFIADKVPACAVVRTNDEAGQMLTEDIILEHVKQHEIEIYHIKGGVYFVNSLPKTTSGKVQQSNVYNLCKILKNGNE